MLNATARRMGPRVHGDDSLRDYSSPCAFGITCVGWICGVGFASTIGTADGGFAGTSAGVAWTAADCCAGSGAGLAANGLISGFTSPACGGDAFGSGTAGMRLATRGTEAGGRGTPLKLLIGGSDPVGP